MKGIFRRILEYCSEGLLEKQKFGAIIEGISERLVRKVSDGIFGRIHGVISRAMNIQWNS